MLHDARAVGPRGAAAPTCSIKTGCHGSALPALKLCFRDKKSGQAGTTCTSPHHHNSPATPRALKATRRRHEDVPQTTSRSENLEPGTPEPPRPRTRAHANAPAHVPARRCGRPAQDHLLTPMPARDASTRGNTHASGSRPGPCVPAPPAANAWAGKRADGITGLTPNNIGTLRPPPLRTPDPTAHKRTRRPQSNHYHPPALTFDRRGHARDADRKPPGLYPRGPPGLPLARGIPRKRLSVASESEGPDLGGRPFPAAPA